MSELPAGQQRLLEDLEAADAPEWILSETRKLQFHDVESGLALPKMTLVAHLNNLGLDELAQKAIDGAYDDAAP